MRLTPLRSVKPRYSYTLHLKTPDDDAVASVETEIPTKTKPPQRREESELTSHRRARLTKEVPCFDQCQLVIISRL